MTVLHQVLIPVFNGADHLALTMDNILAQDLEELEVIVSDNASDDATPEILAGYADDPRLTISRSPTNVGMFGNWDRLLGMVTAPSYTLISHDDLLSGPDVLSRAVAALNAKPDCPAVFSDIAYIDGAGQPTGARRFARSGPFKAKDWVRKSILSCRNQLGQPLAVRSDAVRELRFDQRLKYAGDFGFAAHLALSQGQPVHLPEPMFVYRMHGGSGTLKLQKHALADMRLIAQDVGIDLSAGELWQQRLAFHATTLARSAVLRGMALLAALKPQKRP